MPPNLARQLRQSRADAQLTTQIWNFDPGLGPFQCIHDLAVGKSRLLHVELLC